MIILRVFFWMDKIKRTKCFLWQRNNQGGKRRINSRTSMAQREDRIRRTVYVSDIDQQVSLSLPFFQNSRLMWLLLYIYFFIFERQVTEEQLAALFITCGQVMVFVPILLTRKYLCVCMHSSPYVCI